MRPEKAAAQRFLEGELDVAVARSERSVECFFRIEILVAIQFAGSVRNEARSAVLCRRLDNLKDQRRGGRLQKERRIRTLGMFN